MSMSEKKVRKVTVELNPVEMVWLHSQHLFQKIEESSITGQNQIKFFKNNSGVEIRFQGNEGDSSDLLKAREQLMRIINSNQIRLISTSLHKDNYIRISKQARKQFPKSYIIFLHYETFENCSRKLQEKFNITSITPELERLRKANPYFCFLIAEKQKIDDIQKFTKRILNSQVSCASTTFSHKREAPPLSLQCKRAMSVSSLRGSFSDQNEEQYRISVHQNPVEEQLFEMSESILLNLQSSQLQSVKQRGLFEGCAIKIQKHEGTYSSLLKKLYYANRLQLTANPYMQPIYAYHMTQKTPYHWCLTLLTDQKYRSLKQICRSQWILNYRNKLQLLVKLGKALVLLHKNMQTYCGLNWQTVLLDGNNNVYLSAVIQKQILPHTNPFLFDIRKYLMLMYWLFTQNHLSYEMLVFKQQKQQYFCTLSHKCKNNIVRDFLNEADKLFIGDLTLQEFVEKSQQFRQG